MIQPRGAASVLAELVHRLNLAAAAAHLCAVLANVEQCPHHGTVAYRGGDLDVIKRVVSPIPESGHARN
jgi:hypothetical protein